MRRRPHLEVPPRVVFWSELGDDARELETHALAVLGGGERLALRAGIEGVRAILVAGKPIREPVARHGPFVMNTREELMQAFVDFQQGRF